MSKKLPLIYSCSGCSSAAQMANHIALQMDRRGIAEMSCIAGVGGGVAPLVRKAGTAKGIIALDGCPLHCAEHCLKREGLKSTFHYDLSKFGVVKKHRQCFDEREAGDVEGRIVKDLESHGAIGPNPAAENQDRINP